MSDSGWIGVDLDGTLAHYDGWVSGEHIGKPVPAMVARVKAWLGEGRDVRIFTARIFPLTFVDPTGLCYTSDGLDPSMADAMKAVPVIRGWCTEHIGQALALTSLKDQQMVELWDDRCVQVERNTGRRVDDIAELRAELDRLRADQAEAAGALLIDVPEPGTDAAKLLSANRLLHGEVARLRAVLDTEIERLTKERDEARRFGEDAARKYNESLVLRCAFCGMAYEDGTPRTRHERLTAHVMVCREHPIRMIEQQRDLARAELSALQRRVDEACAVTGCCRSLEDMRDTVIKRTRRLAALGRERRRANERYRHDRR